MTGAQAEVGPAPESGPGANVWKRALRLFRLATQGGHHRCLPICDLALIVALGVT